MDFTNQKIDRDSSRLVYAWLFFAVSSLIFAGIFAFLVAMARTPVIQDILPGKDYIRIALVGHVILSVVIWFLAFEGVLWTFTSTEFLGVRIFNRAVAWSGFWLSVAGTVFIVIAAIFGLGIPLFINYIPVLTHPLFYTGLLILAAGIAITLLNTFLTIRKAFKERTYSGPVPLITFGMAMSVWQLQLHLSVLGFLTIFRYLHLRGRYCWTLRHSSGGVDIFSSLQIPSQWLLYGFFRQILYLKNFQ